MNRHKVGGNYVCCLVIVVIFMGLGKAKRKRGLKSSYGGKLKEVLSRKPKVGEWGGGGNFFGKLGNFW